MAVVAVVVVGIHGTLATCGFYLEIRLHLAAPEYSFERKNRN
jgi:hypothetical protein